MPFTVTMPKLSPTMEEGTLVKWCKKPGDKVKSGEVLFEVATDKATLEHTALDGGYLRSILVQEGASARVNQPLAIFTEEKEESIEGYEPEGEMPQEEEKPEEKVEAPTTKEPTPKPSKTGLSQPAFVPEPPLTDYQLSLPEEAKERVMASPLAKKVAKEKGVDLSTVKGSGPGGRVVAADLGLAQPDLPVTFGRQALPKDPPGSYEEIPLTPIRKVIAQRLQESKTFIPHFYVVQEVEVSALARVRKELAEAGLKISINDFILRATALTLKEHPEVNAGFNSVNNTLIRFKTIDISVAVSTPTGLITPIVRHADYKNLGQLSQEVKWLVGKAREGTLSREEYTGGSFTLSNLGMYGISSFSAIINPPQAAILAVGGIEEKAIVKEGSVQPGKVMTLTVSADHRVIDGADAAQFLKRLKGYLETPSLLLL